MTKVKNALAGKKKLIAALVVVLQVVAAYSLLYLDFGLIRSESSVAAHATTFAAMEPELNLSGVVYLYVEGKDAVRAPLERELKQELTTGMYAEVKSFGNLKEQFDGPVVAVYVLREDLFYTPLYAQPDAEVLYLFSNSGSTEYFEAFVRSEFGAVEPVVNFTSIEGPQLLDKATINVRASMTGLFSLKACRRHLAEEVADEICTRLNNLT
jgi:hypothetical protein